MSDNHNKLISGLENLFPGHIKVYDVSTCKNDVPGVSLSLLNRHFREPLSNELLDRLVMEIAGFLQYKEQSSVYSFFHLHSEKDCIEPEWFLSCARLVKCEKGCPKEIVIFSYDLSLLGESKRKLYRVLQNEEFFKNNIHKVSTLTKKEKEIIVLLANGMSSTEIAAAIYISVHTVNTHRKRINDKLAVANIAGLLKFVEVFDLAIDRKI